MLQPARPHWPHGLDGYFMHVGAFLQVTGTARQPADSTSKTQGRAQSRDQAIVDAWERLREYILSLPLPGYGHVRVKAQEEPGFAKRLDTLVYSSQIVETRYSGGVAAVVVRIEKSRINQLLETDFQ